MSFDAFNPPAPPELSPSRVAARREHLLAELRADHAHPNRLRLRFGPQSRPRRLALIVAAVFLLAGVGTAIGVGVDLLASDVAFHKRFDRGGPLSPRPTSSFVYITRGSDWALIAWKSTRGICLDYAYEGPERPERLHGLGRLRDARRRLPT